MEKHLYILYFCVIVLTGYIVYLRRNLFKVIVILNIQKKLCINKGTQTLCNEDSSTDLISDVPEPYINLHQENRDQSAISTLEERYHQRKKRYHRRKKIWQRENYYQ